MSVSKEVSDWIDAAIASTTAKAPVMTLQRFLREGEARTAQPGLTTLERARVYLTTAGLRLGLVEQKTDRRVNAMQGFRDLQTAVSLAPEDVIVSRAYSQTLYAMNHLGFMMKKLSELGLGIKIADETRRTIRLLAAHPADAEAQVGRELLSRALGDDASVQAATRALATLPPEDVAKARAAYEATRSHARNAKE